MTPETCAALRYPTDERKLVEEIAHLSAEALTLAVEIENRAAALQEKHKRIARLALRLGNNL
jgi:hypothetical protein